MISGARVDDAPDAQHRSQTAGSSLLPPTTPQQPPRPQMNPSNTVKIATTSHAAAKNMFSYDNVHQRLVSERDTLKLKVQRALRGVLETSGLTAAEVKRVAANLQDPTEWLPHQAAIRRAFGPYADLVGITIKVVLRLIRKLDEILNERYPVVSHLNNPNEPLLIHCPSRPQAKPHVHVDVGPEPRRQRSTLAAFSRSAYISFRGSRKVKDCDRMLAELSRGVENLRTIIFEQRRLNREELPDVQEKYAGYFV
ncbi:hypothetical protein FN846DRAFT_986301 [Sphaerosporella brunnea]|uniref:Uncharacterized protein n=1 Tax=Sphaerosporella brunnea TaxID=1250544 RepID=A0A5J5ETE3_9PEZI|nr:hypothetical protein FN846DRAFT_986301 [Sphaerosporella brunnea]